METMMRPFKRMRFDEPENSKKRRFECLANEMNEIISNKHLLKNGTWTLYTRYQTSYTNFNQINWYYFINVLKSVLIKIYNQKHMLSTKLIWIKHSVVKMAKYVNIPDLPRNSMSIISLIEEFNEWNVYNICSKIESF